MGDKKSGINNYSVPSCFSDKQIFGEF